MRYLLGPLTRHREMKLHLMQRVAEARRRLIAARLRSMQKEAEEARERLDEDALGADIVKFE